MSESQEALHFLDYWQVVRSRKEVVVTFALLVVLAGVVVTFYTPKTYMASTIIQVKKDSPDVNVFTRDPVVFDPLFLRTQFQIIQSATVMEDVIKRLELDKKLAKAYKYDFLPPEKIFDQTLRLVRKGMRAQQYRDTDLIEIKIQLQELGGEIEDAPRMAADIANTIADVYRDQSLGRIREVIKRALDALYDELQVQNKRVEDAQKVVDQIRQEHEITVLYDPVGTTSDAKKLNLRALEEEGIKVRMALESQKSKYEKAISLTTEELLAAAPYLQADPSLARLVDSRRQAEVTLNDKLRAKLGPNHPEVIQAQAMLTGLDAQIAMAVNGLKTGMLAELQAAEARYKWVMDELSKHREDDRFQESGAYRQFNKALDELRRVREIRNNLEERYIKEKIEMDIPKSMVQVVEIAKPPDIDDPVSPDFLLNIILSIVLGLGVGIGLAYVIEYLDTSVKTIEDVERYLGVPVIGVIPQKVKPFNDPAADMRHAEAYRMLRTNIQFSRKMNNGKVVCLTSSSMGEGKSLTVFNLAHVCSELGDKILVVDADLHRPRQHKMFKIANKTGLANVLAGEIDLADAVVATDNSNIDFLPSGRMSAGVHGLFDSMKLHETVRMLRENYGMILFDAPPVIGVSDTSTLIREMDGVILVIQHRKYPKTVPKRAKSMIENMGANLIGVLLNNINISKDYSSYQHHSYTYS